MKNPDDKRHRLAQEAAENKHKRWRGSVLFIAILLAIGIAFAIAVAIVRDPNATEPDKRWAAAITSSIITGLVGYVTGKATT